MACDSLITTANECGKNTKSGVKSDVFLIAVSDMKAVSGSTEVYTETAGLVSAIGLATGTTKFVKYGTVAKQAGIKETYTYNDNGSYDITVELNFSLSNVGSLTGKVAVENLISNPVAALVRLETGTWIFINNLLAKTIEGTVASDSNGRVITLNTSSTQFLQPVDPTIISGLIAA